MSTNKIDSCAKAFEQESRIPRTKRCKNEYDLIFKVVISNPETRNKVLELCRSNSNDSETLRDQKINILLNLVYFDEIYQWRYHNMFKDNQEMMDIYDAAASIREILHFDEFERFIDEILLERMLKIK